MIEQFILNEYTAKVSRIGERLPGHLWYLSTNDVHVFFNFIFVVPCRVNRLFTDLKTRQEFIRRSILIYESPTRETEEEEEH